MSGQCHVHDIKRECVASCDMRVAHETEASFLHLLPSNRCLLLITSPTIPHPVTHLIRSFIVVHSTQLLSSSKILNKSTSNFELNQIFVRNWPVKQVLPRHFFFNIRSNYNQLYPAHYHAYDKLWLLFCFTLLMKILTCPQNSAKYFTTK